METKYVSNIYTLNKSTYVVLRWIAIIGQFLTVNIVFFSFDFNFHILLTNTIIFFGVITNIFLIYFYNKNLLTNRASFLFLIIDILQLSAIIYLTGGILNPFSILILAPVITSASYLKLNSFDDIFNNFFNLFS